MPLRRSFGLFSTTLLPLAALALWPRTGAAIPTEPGTLTNDLAESTSCQNCHSFPNAFQHGADAPYAPYFGWQGTLMANAARDPVFWAGVAIADQDHPGETEVCIRCHSARAFLNGRGNATSIDDLMPADFDGVGCELCHRMTNEGLLGNAQYALDDVLGPTGTVSRHGPWTYEPGSPGAPAHEWVQDPFTGSSELCGTCHDVTTDRQRVDDDGNEIGMLFNEQRTYSEWLGSAYAQPGDGFASCQDCHMPAVTDMPGCNDNVDEFSHPTGGRRHDLVGANRSMVQLLRAEYGNDGTGEVDNFFFDLSIERMDEMLATAATLEVEAPKNVDLGAGIEDLQVTVTNNTGHKLPSGYSEGRIMWVEVIARYGEEVVWSSGQWEAGNAKGPASDPQLRSYEGVAEEYASGTTLHLLLNDHWVVDNRIPPLGLTPDPQTDPVGDRYTLQEDGTWPNFDVATYAFEGNTDVQDATPADDNDDVLDVSVRLLYLINTPEYIQFLADENKTNEAGNDVEMMFDDLGGAEPIVLGEQNLSLQIVGFGEPATGSTGTADETAGPADTTNGSNETTAAADTVAGTETDPGADGGDGGGGGCGCSSDGRSDAAWWLLAPLGLMLRRRRRR